MRGVDHLPQDHLPIFDRDSEWPENMPLSQVVAATDRPAFCD